MNRLNKILPEQILAFFTKGHERSIKAKKNVAASLIIKGLDIFIGLLLVPMVLNYLDQTRYGIWLTMTSIVVWFDFCDIGLGHGLRNKFAEAKSVGDDEKAKIYVSTSYAILSAMMLVFFTLFIIVNKFLPWPRILNVEQDINSNLSILALIVFGFFALKFVTKLITTIIVADQKPAICDAIRLSGRILTIAIIYVFTKTIPGSLIYMGLAYAGLPVLILILSSFYFYTKSYKKYRPSLKYVDLSYTKDLIGLGGKFFIIQIALVVIMSTDNIIISQLYGPKLVTPYQIAHKYFGLLLMIYVIIISPVWSATIESFAKKDYKWIKSVVKKLQRILLIFVSIAILMFMVAKNIYTFWVGKDIEISYLLSAFWMLFVIVGMINGIYCNIINGIGKIKLQMYVYTFSMIINIPLSVFFAKTLQLGIEGVILATVICQSLHLIYLPIQYKKIISDNAKGIWNK